MIEGAIELLLDRLQEEIAGFFDPTMADPREGILFECCDSTEVPALFSVSDVRLNHAKVEVVLHSTLIEDCDEVLRWISAREIRCVVYSCAFVKAEKLSAVLPARKVWTAGRGADY